MTNVLLHYVCDRCGEMWAGFEAERCVRCDHDAIWEFVLQKNAREHAATIAVIRSDSYPCSRRSP